MPPEHLDPGLSHERTALAWRRTALSTAALALLLVRLGAARGEPSQLFLGTGVLLTAAVLALLGGSAASRRPAWRRGLVHAVAVALTALCAATPVVVLIQT